MGNYIFPTLTDRETKLPFYIVGIGCHHEQEHVNRPDGYPNYQWIQCHHGKGELALPSGIYKIIEGQGMLLYPNEPHEYYSLGGSWQVDWIIFDGSSIKAFFSQNPLNMSRVFYVSKPELILSKIRLAQTMAMSANPLKNIDCSILVYDILINLMKYISLEGTGSELQKNLRLKPIFEYIETNYNRPILLNDLSEVIHVSPQHLCTMFRKILGCRVFEYINNVRIQKSKELILAFSDRPINEIYQLVGFEDFSYFCSVFKKIEKASPTEFRIMHGK